jgi:hypothetical protein
LSNQCEGRAKRCGGNVAAGPCASWRYSRVSSPRGSFILQIGDEPVVLLSAGIGATPVQAVLHTLAAEQSPPAGPMVPFLLRFR